VRYESITAARFGRLEAAVVPLTAMVAAVLSLSLATFNPLLVLGAGAACVLGAVLLASIDAATMLAVFVLYSNAAVIFQLHPWYPALVAMSAVLLTIPAFRYLFLRMQPARTDTVFLLMLALLASMLVSCFVAKDTGIALANVGQYAVEGLALYWLLINVIRSGATLMRALWVTVLTAALLATLSAYQAASGAYTQQFGGLAQRQLRHTLVDPAADPDASLPPATPKPNDAVVDVADRAAGPIGDPNRYAQILLMAAPFAVFLAFRARTAVARLIARLATLAILCGVFLTYSRGAFLTIALLGCLLVVWRYVRPSVAVLGALLVAVTVVAAAPTYVARMATILNAQDLGTSDGNGVPDAAIRGRATEMFAALAVFVDHPLIGVGPGQYVPFYSQSYQLIEELKFRSLARPREPHSLFIAMAAETGLLGLGIFIAIFAVLLRRLLRTRRYWLTRDPNRAHLTTAFVFGVLAYLGTGVFLHLAYERYFWYLLGVTGAVLRLLRDDAIAFEAQCLQGSR
jgi:O-antigen ligase/polysaccharide polymerase Wzy-like membrane protein